MSTNEQPSHGPCWRRITRRALEWLALGLTGLFLFIATVLVLARVVFTDERLGRMGQQALAERTGAEVELDNLRVSLFSGIELGPTRIGPPPGFIHDIVVFDRLAVKWSAADLLVLDIVIPELALEGVSFTLEENEHGSNLDALVAALAGPPAPEEPEEPEEPEPGEPTRLLEQPELPVSIRLERLAVSIDSVRVDRPDLDLEADHIGLYGHLEGEGTALSLDLWAGLGDREPEGSTSVLTLSGTDLTGDLRVEQRLGVAVTSTGMDDIHVELDWTADGTVSTDEPLPPIHLAAEIDAGANLLDQSAELQQLLIGIGESTRLALAATARELFATPVADVQTLELSSNLGELAPLLATFVHGADVTGELVLGAEPFVVVASASAATSTNASLALLFSDVNVALGDVAQIGGVDVGVQLVTEDGLATVQVDGTVPRAQSAGQTVRDLHLVLTGESPIAPWLNGTPGTADARLEITALRAGGDAAVGSGVKLTTTASAPIELLLRSQATGDPVEARLRLGARRADFPATRINGFRLELGARTWDLTGERLEADLDANAETVAIDLGEDKLTLPHTQLQIDAERRGQRFNVRRVILSTAKAIELELGGVADAALTPRPRLRDVSVRLGLLDVERTLSLLPPSLQPDLIARGGAEVRFAIDGTLAYRELARRVQLPTIESDDLGARVQALADFIEGWEKTFRRGLPVVTSADLSLLDLQLVSPAAVVDGLALDLDVAIEKHGPRTGLVVIANRLEYPVALSNLRTDVELSYRDGFFNVGLSSTIGAVDDESLAQPIRNISADLSLRYRLGGDLLLDELSVTAPEPGMFLSASGVLSKPLQFFLTRGWERPGLPGLSAALRWNTGLDLGDELRAIRAGGPQLAGGLALTGVVRAERGAVSFDGMLESFDFQIDDPDQGTRLKDLSGGLPVDVEVTFDPRGDATVVRRHLSLGSGVFAVVTSADDIRKRPARPVYYDRLRPYRQQRGLSFRSFRSGNVDIEDFELTGRITEGMLLVDRLAMHILGGDIDGSMAVQLGRDASLRTDLAVKVSNIDASYFKVLKVEPGASSELSADMQLAFLAAPWGRNLTLDMNFTKISTDTLDRFLLLLDGGDEDGPNSSVRGLLGLVYIENVKAWIRYENLSMDLDAAQILRIPWTTMGYPNIDREIVRLFSLTEILDTYAQGPIDKNLAPLLGWKDED